MRSPRTSRLSILFPAPELAPQPRATDRHRAESSEDAHFQPRQTALRNLRWIVLVLMPLVPAVIGAVFGGSGAPDRAMKFRTTLMLLALAAAIFAFIKFYESKRPDTEEARRRAECRQFRARQDRRDRHSERRRQDRIATADKKWRLEIPDQRSGRRRRCRQFTLRSRDWQKDATISAKEIEADKSRLEEYG